MKLSIVATLYESAAYISEFHARATASAKKMVGEDYEIIFVNDGSPDNSLSIAVQLTENDSNVVVVDLSRNFGHHKAMMTGLSYAKGQLIFLIDSDLEEEPEWLIDFANEIHNRKCDVIYGIQDQRKGDSFERWSGKWFYTLFNFISGIKLPINIVTARLMSRRYVDALLSHKEKELMIAGLWLITGFQQCGLKVKKLNTSKTTYTLSKKVEVFVNSITSFSNRPLHLIFYTGLLISFISLIYIFYLVYRYIFLSTPLNGWTSVMASIWFLGGIIISFIGVVAIYISKIFIEVKNRPYTIVRDVFRFSERQDENN